MRVKNIVHFLFWMCKSENKWTTFFDVRKASIKKEKKCKLEFGQETENESFLFPFFLLEKFQTFSSD